MRLVAALLLVLGCKKNPPTTFDPDLPEKAVEIEAVAPMALLKAMAGDDDTSNRGRALAFLVEHDDPQVWGPRALYDPDAWVQRVAAEQLLARGETKMLAAYVERADADAYVRGWVAVRLAKAPIEKAWRHEPDPYRAAPLAFAALAHGYDAQKPLLRAVSHGELALEESFVRDLGECRSFERMPAGACEHLKTALQTGEEWVEEELALAYGAARLVLGDGSGEQLLRKGLGGNLRTQFATLDHLAVLHTNEAGALLRKARGSNEERTQIYANLITASREDGHIDVFNRASEHPNTEVRALAARFAGVRLQNGFKKQARQVEQVISNAATDRAAEVRQAALEAAVHARLTDRSLFQAALVDESPAVRILAAGGLLQQGT